MGLNISHGTWIGSYGAFMAWRKRIAQIAGLPPLELMEGFYVPIEEGEHDYSWNWIERTQKVVTGLRLAHKNKEDLIFS